MLNVLWFLLLVFWIDSILCKICDIEDKDCTTKRANNSYGPFVNGMDLVEASDPLLLDLINADLPTMKYRLTNASMSGMKDCVVMKLIINRKESSFEFDLDCPRFVTNFDYEMKGNITSDLYVEGNGTSTITCDDHVLMFNGIFYKHIAVDNKPDVQIISHKVDVETKGRVTFDFENLFDGDKEKSDSVNKVLNENWKNMDKLLHAPVVHSFMDVFIENLNAFLQAVPVENVLASES